MDVLQKELENRYSEIKKEIKAIYEANLHITGWDVPELDEAKAKMREELLAQGKPEKIIDNIIKGKIERFIEDNTQLDQRYALLSQKYVMDDKKTVAEAIKDVDSSIEIVEYIRFELGGYREKRRRLRSRSCSANGLILRD